MKLVFASSNCGKLLEVRAVLQPEFEILSLEQVAQQIKKAIPAMPETADTYEGNAKIKANIIYNWCGLPCLADDSGLEVKALGGRPGLLSARYAGENSSADENIDKLLRDMSQFADRRAELLCTLFFTAGQNEFLAEGKIATEVAKERSGGGGFGYDPILFLPSLKKTLAEVKALDLPFKTHRDLALDKIKELLIAVGG